MKKDFAPYQQSLDMKELGFDEPCFGGYYSNQNNVNLWFFKEAKNSDRDERVRDGFATAPLYQQAFRWFREKYGLFTQPNRTVDKEGAWYYFSIETKRTDVCEGSFSYEEAELACLIKLIEIVKTK
jgi:hypothetical protein